MPAEKLVVAAFAACAIAATGPVLRFGLRRRGQRELAADLASLRWPLRALAVAWFSRIALARAEVAGLTPLLSSVVIASYAWLVVALLLVGQRLLARRLQIDAPDNLLARSRMTQIELLRRVLTTLVAIGTVFVILVTATPMRGLGPSLVAYAGLIGVVLGLALRAPLENLVAGILVALTEPIRLDDVVVVEGEWGRIEQIGLVNVIVRAWDDRRVVLPTSYFIGSTFENWTRRTSHLTATVMLWVDYDVDMTGLRREFERAVAASSSWDRRTCVLQVVELGERAVQVRGLATAADASAAWDLRCEVREALLRYLVESGSAPAQWRIDADALRGTRL